MGGKAKLKRLGVFSVAKLEAIIFAVIGLIEGVFFAIVGAMLAPFLPGGEASLGALGFGGILSIVVMPIIFGIIGFIGGAVGAFFYNLVAGAVGGIEMEFEEEQ